MRCVREHLSAHSRAPHLFNLIFGPTIALVIDHLNDFLFTCQDALGILLIIRIVCPHGHPMQVRRPPQQPRKEMIRDDDDNDAIACELTHSFCTFSAAFLRRQYRRVRCLDAVFDRMNILL
jgi:hypothetical protein